MDENTRGELKNWLRGREAIWPIVMRFPPACVVRPTRPLSSPRVSGQVFSYTEHGTVSVVEDGNPIRGFCEPDWLEVVESHIPVEMVREVIDELRREAS